MSKLQTSSPSYGNEDLIRFHQGLKHAAALRDQLATAEATRYLNDPVGFVRDRLGGTLWSKQREIAESVAQNKRTAVPSCFDSGKSHVAAALVCWWIECHPPGEAIAVTSAPTAYQVRDILWKEIRRMHSKGHLRGRVNLTEWFAPYAGQEELVAVGRKPSTDAASGEGAAFTGRHARYVLVVLDEGGGIEEALYDAAEGLITNEDARILVIGNPWRPTHKFGKMCRADSGWNVIRIPANVTPNFTEEGAQLPEFLGKVLITPSWVEERAKDWGVDDPRYISKVKALFPESTENGLFELSWIEAAQRRSLPLTAPQEAGVDVADEGKDSSVIYLRHGGHVRLWGSWRGPGVMTTAGYIRQFWREDTTLGRLKVDSSPPGVVARLKEMEPLMPVVAVSVGMPSSQPKKFYNAKAEWFWHLRDLFEDGKIDLDPRDEELVTQLLSIRWWPDSRGRVQIEPKPAMRARGEPSPDRADALMLCFAERVPGGAGPKYRHYDKPPKPTVVDDWEGLHSRGTVRGRSQTLCGGLGYLCGSELEVRSDVRDLDLDALTLVWNRTASVLLRRLRHRPAKDEDNVFGFSLPFELACP